MNDLQSKLGGGINKIQDGIQQGKQKIQTAQEVNQLKKQLQGMMDERGTMIFKLGEEAYKKIRIGEISSPDFTALAELIFQKDHEIYGLQEKLVDITKTSDEEKQCLNCQTPISSSDKFCGSCGTPIASGASVASTDVESISCYKCEVMVPSSAIYCGCCGSKM